MARELHAYSTVPEDRHKATLLLVLASVGITALLGILVQALSDISYVKAFVEWLRSQGLKALIALPTISLLTVYGLLNRLFEFVLWKFTFRGRTISGIPNISGDWWCYYHSDRPSGPKAATVRMIIRQTWNKISIELIATNSCSWSSMATLDCSGRTLELSYAFKNEHNKTPGKSPYASFHGLAEMRDIADESSEPGTDRGQVFRGTYFTDTQRRSYGWMIMARSKDHPQLQSASQNLGNLVLQTRDQEVKPSEGADDEFQEGKPVMH